MRQKRTGIEHTGASAGAEDVLIVCRIFNDLITERLCSLRRQELSASWTCSCAVNAAAPGAGPKAGPLGKSRGELKQKGKAGRQGMH